MRGLLKRSGKRTVCGMVSSRNQKPPSWEKARVATALYHAEAFVCLLKSAPSRIMRAKPTKNQQDRQPALAYEPGGRRFESCWARHFSEQNRLPSVVRSPTVTSLLT